MSNGVISRSDDYAVRPNTPVTLTIVIGEEQSGDTEVRQGGKTLGSGKITNLTIDDKTKSIMCTTTVKRINPATKHTSVTYQLRGGVQDRDYIYEADVDQMGERAIYKASFVFA